MFDIRIANLQVQIDNRFEHIETLCRDYRTESSDADIAVRIDAQAIDFERRAAGEAFGDDYLETLAVYRAIGEHLPIFDAFIFHSAVIARDGVAYAFAAKSGTGKSTHIRHWKALHGDRISPVNGDKPIFRFVDGVLYACGTPWAGKEGWQRNVCVPLGGICFLERGQEDCICPIRPAEALPKALSQIYLPHGRSSAEKTLSLLDRTLRTVPLWKLQCTDSIHAAEVASSAMMGTTQT